VNVEFHYYAVHALALEAGLDSSFARDLACASQYVDAATVALSLATPRGAYRVEATQNYTFWDEAVRSDVYLPFHFLPGNAAEAAAKRRDGARNPYAVTPNGELAKGLLVAALRDKDPFIIGVALHAFADTWAHQNFSGLLEGFNELPGSSVSALPAAGHLHAMAKPDAPDGRWRDERLVDPAIDNAARFRQAARKIYRYLCVYAGKAFGDEDVVCDRLVDIWRKPNGQERMADYVIEYGMESWDRDSWRAEAGLPPDRSALSGVRHYDKLSWAKAEFAKAFLDNDEAVPVEANFYSSRLYRWAEAAAEHRRRAKAALAKAGLIGGNV
jgi:hypothetical protein